MGSSERGEGEGEMSDSFLSACRGWTIIRPPPPPSLSSSTSAVLLSMHCILTTRPWHPPPPSRRPAPQPQTATYYPPPRPDPLRAVLCHHRHLHLHRPPLSPTATLLSFSRRFNIGRIPAISTLPATSASRVDRNTMAPSSGDVDCKGWQRWEEAEGRRLCEVGCGRACLARVEARRLVTAE